MIIGICGTNGAGKDTLADYFKEKGFRYYSLSDILREELAKEGTPESRDSMGAKSEELRKKFGNGILSKRILEKIKPGENAIVVSIRSPGEASELMRNPEFKLLGVDAPIELRYERVHGRGRSGDDLSLEEFKRVDAIERRGEENQQEIDKVLQKADVVFVNDSTKEAFIKKIEETITHMIQGSSEPLGSPEEI